MDKPSTTTKTCRECGKLLHRQTRTGICQYCIQANKAYMPTPEQIEASARQIRAEWSEERWQQELPKKAKSLDRPHRLLLPRNTQLPPPE